MKKNLCLLALLLTAGCGMRDGKKDYTDRDLVGVWDQIGVDQVCNERLTLNGDKTCSQYTKKAMTYALIVE